ncbi:MAG: TetR/AcrR family transcriptional regulator [Treponema sp.]|nr:TetR/AcrR family transcriptional regulator [Treponema sp.]
MAESTKERIIQAAFSFYTVPNFERVSLSQIAGRVGISKAAIFKHFKNKEALSNEMNSRICESLIEMFKPMLEFFEQNQPGKAMSCIINYLLGHREYLGYLLSMSMLFNENFIISELRNRGVDIFDSIFNMDGSIKELKRYLVMEFIGNTLIFFTMKRIHDGDYNKERLIPVEEFSESVCFLIENGIAGNDSIIDNEKLDRVNKICVERVKTIKPVNKMLKVIAGIIDKVGVTGLTVEKIAGALGMAKSSLYSSFENKVDMISTLIENEFETLRDLIVNNISQLDSSYEKLYSIMQTEFCYFRERPELMMIFRNLLMNKALKDRFENQKDESCGNGFLKDFFSGEFFNESVLLWILVLPVMIYGSFQNRGLEADEMQDSLKEIFLMVEFGVKNK